ncbi:MAG: purine-nucleoside phosphorylase [Lachnospiraceae bacterium]|nr:purine-nucleoside phosphorylase [Lachnospiraceae bacterium]
MANTDFMEKLEGVFNSVREKTDFVPKVGLVLGSGLGEFAKEINVSFELPYSEIEGFPVSTVPGHDGKFIFGYIADVPIVCMKGRVHYYEGYKVSDVVLPIRLMIKLGIKTLFLTNAAGGLKEGFSAGDLMLITDHISVFAPNPLIGPNDPEMGPRFPDMTEVYNLKIREKIQEIAYENDIPLETGVYCQLTGPTYETPAEIKMLKTLGVDAVGMSTVVEAIAARHMGVNVCGISCISNLAAGISKTPLSHAEVQQAADEAAPRFTRLVTEVIKTLG